MCFVQQSFIVGVQYCIALHVQSDIELINVLISDSLSPIWSPLTIHLPSHSSHLTMTMRTCCVFYSAYLLSLKMSNQEKAQISVFKGKRKRSKPYCAALTSRQEGRGTRGTLGNFGGKKVNKCKILLFKHIPSQN